MSTERVLLRSILSLGLLILAGIPLAVGTSDLTLAAVPTPPPDGPPFPGSPPGDAWERAPGSPASARPDVASLALGETLFQFNVEAATGDIQMLGVEFDGTHYWATGANSSTDPNKLYKLDTGGNLVAAYDQPAGCGGWGGRDLAYDGAYLYFGCDDGFVHGIDPATGSQAVTMTAPITPARGLAYDPATDHFWTANWDSAIYEFSRAGAVITSCAPVGLSTFGMAWDEVSEDGPYLWLWSQPGVLASQFDPGSCALTGVSFVGQEISPTNLAGGATIRDDVVPDRLVLLGMHQAISDTVVAYDLGDLPGSLVYLPIVVRGVIP